MAGAILLAGGSAFAQGTAAGLSWLRAHQGAGGAWAGDARLEIRDTAEVVRAFALLAPTDAALLGGVSALSATSGATVDLEARRLAALRPYLPEVVLALPLAGLAAAQATDGGWGFDGGDSASDALDTALALRALVGTSALSGQALRRALDRLASADLWAGSGHAQAIGGPQDDVTSAEVVRAAAFAGQFTAVDFARTGDGPFLAGELAAGSAPEIAGGAADVTATALAARALLELGSTGGSGLVAAQTFLRAAQLPDGSWLDDPYTTALALQVISENRPDLALTAATTASPNATQGTPVTVNVSIGSVGFADAGASAVAVYAGNPDAGGHLLARTDLSAVAVGATATRALVVDTSSLSGPVALFAVVDPDKALNEVTRLNNTIAVGLYVWPYGTTPPSGGSGSNHAPIITSVAPSTAILGTTFTYQVSAFDADHDAIVFDLVTSGALSPVGLAIDHNTGLVTWSLLPPNVTGRYAFAVIARDTAGASSQQSVVIEVLDAGAKRPPVFDSSPLSSARPGNLYRYDVVARDPDGGLVSVVLASGPVGMVLGPPAGGAPPDAIATLTWTPATADVGDVAVRLAALDDEAQSAAQEWTLVVSSDDRQIVDLVAVKADRSGLVAAADPQGLPASPTVSGTVLVTVANQGNHAAGAFDVVVFEERDGVEGFSAARDQVLGRISMASLGAGAVARDVPVTVTAKGVLFAGDRVFAAVDPDGAVIESREDNNLIASGEDEPLLTTPGTFHIAEKLHFQGNGAGDTFTSVIHTPVVAQLNDDDGDGKAGPGDVPEIVFVAHSVSTGGGHLRAVNGRTGALELDVFVSDAMVGTAPLVVDADGDGFPEIYVSCTNVVRAYSHGGTPLWVGSTGGVTLSALTAADLDGDGRAEIIAGGRIMDSTDGHTRCTPPLLSDPGPNATVVDLDLDGTPEILVGNYAMRADCSIAWGHPEFVNGSTDYKAKGAPAFGQFDADPNPEVVIVDYGAMHLLQHDGTVAWTVSADVSGPPAIGDVDGDGHADIVVAGTGKLRAYKGDGSLRWSMDIHDISSASNGVALADLNGDGRLEVLYQDELRMYVINGASGAVMYSNDHVQSGTSFELPAVADADGDGRLDIVAAANLFYSPSIKAPPPSDSTGVRVFGDASWAAGRPLWHQYEYHVTNVRCDQTVPAHEARAWQVLGTMRAQQDVPRALLADMHCETGAPDLSASFLRVDRSACSDHVTVLARIGNGGLRSVPAGAAVDLRVASGTGSFVAVATAQTSKSLGPGEFEDVSMAVPLGAGTPVTPVTGPHTLLVRVDPNGLVADSDLGNDQVGATVTFCDTADSPPFVLVDGSSTAVVDQPYTAQVRTSDADSDPVAVTLLSAPTGAQLGSDGLISWTPSAAQLGTQGFIVGASDGHGGFTTAPFAVLVQMPDAGGEPPVPSPAGLHLALSTDHPSYAPHTTATLTALVGNDGPAGRAGTLVIEVRDGTGAVVATPLASAAIAFTGAGTTTRTATFDTGGLAPGSYTARATYDEGATESTAEASLTIVGSGALTAGLATDHARYGAQQDVRIASTLSNGGTGTLGDLISTITVTAPGGAVLSTQALAAVTLGPGGTSSATTLFGTGTRPAGTYGITLDVAAAGVPMAHLARTFTIESSATSGQAVTGTLDAAIVGAEAQLHASLANAGNTDLTDLTVKLRVLDPGTLAPLRDDVSSVALLAVGQEMPLSATFDATGLAANDVAVLEVSQGDHLLLALSAGFARDTTPPVVTVSAPGCSGDDVVPTFSVVEANPWTLLSAVLDGGAAWTPGTAVTGEGAHTLVITVEDASGNLGSGSATFIVDRTAPVIAVSGVSEGGVYQDATPVVTVSDANLVSSSVLLDGAPLPPPPLAAPLDEGDHVLTATATDCGGHTSTVTVHFAIDRAPPIVSVSAPGCTAQDVVPTFTVNDAHAFTLVSATLDGSTAWTPGTAVTGEGTHTLVIVVDDAAGNRGTASASFVVDRTAPVIAVTGVSEGGVYQSATPAVAVSDANLVSSSSLLDGNPLPAPDAPPLDEGAHVLTATASDCAGHTSAVTVHFSIDRTPPVVSVSAPGCTAEDVVPTFTVTDAHTFTLVSATLDGTTAWTPGAAVTDEGAHTLLVVVEDAAGNLGTGSASFTVDRTAPVIAVTGVSEGGVYQDVTPAVTITDAHLVASSVLLDGAPLPPPPLAAPLDEGDHVLTAAAADCAGHVSDVTVHFAIDRTPPVVSVSAPGCTAQDVVPTFTVSDAHTWSLVSATLDGTTAWTPGSAVTDEGTHTLVIAVADAAGNPGTGSVTFTVDRTAPAIAVAGVSEGGVYQNPTPMVTIVEPNLVASSILLDGAPLPPPLTTLAEGDHVLTATASDCAGHDATPVAVHFSVDRTPPVVTVSAPGCTAMDVVPTFSVSDAHSWMFLGGLLDGGIPWTPGTAITGEGTHTLVVIVLDAAGNPGAGSATFTVDHTAPAIAITGVAEGGLYQDATPVVTITDANPVTSSVLLDGLPLPPPELAGPLSEGAHVLVATATDCSGAGTAVTTTVHFEIDRTPPVIALTMPSCAGGDVTPVLDATDLHDMTAAATLDGAPYAFGTPVVTGTAPRHATWTGAAPIAAEGSHTLTVAVQDGAGNHPDAVVSTFVIDRTAPAITVTGIPSDPSCAAVTPLVAVADVNLTTPFTLTLDGAPFTSGTAITAAGSHTLAVSASDCAGHQAATTRTFTVGTVAQCDSDGAGGTATIVVNGTVTVDFNPTTPTCTGSTALCATATYDRSGATADTWKVTFNTGNKKLLVAAGATITTATVPLTSNNRRAPGIEVRSACGVEVQAGGAVVVASENMQAGTLRLLSRGAIKIDGTLTDSVTGTNGAPGPITVAAACGDLTTGPASIIQTIGQDHGGADIALAACSYGSAVAVTGLVDASYKGSSAATINAVAFSGPVSVDGNSYFGIESGTQRRITGGLTVRSRRDPLPGWVNIQAASDVTVNGNVLLARLYPNIGAVGVKTASSGPTGGVIDVRSLGGRIVASDRAFDDANRYEDTAVVRLAALGDVLLSTSGRSNDVASGQDPQLMPLLSVEAGSSGHGGQNLVQSFAGHINVGAKAQLLADYTSGTGANGSNSLKSCLGVSNAGIVTPADGVSSDDAGLCPGSPPTPQWNGCADFGVSF